MVRGASTPGAAAPGEATASISDASRRRAVRSVEVLGTSHYHDTVIEAERAPRIGRPKTDVTPMRNALALLLASAAVLDLACARTAPPPAPETEVLVTPVVQRDVPIISEWIGTLD